MALDGDYLSNRQLDNFRNSFETDLNQLSEDSLTVRNNITQALDRITEDKVITEEEKQILRDMFDANASDPELPEADKALLRTFYNKFSEKLTTAKSIPLTGEDYDPPPLTTEQVVQSLADAMGKYASPDILSMLAPLLSELSVITARILRQSSVLSQNMMKLTEAMAKDIATLTRNAAEMRAKQEEAKAKEYIALAVIDFVKMTATIVTTIGSEAAGRAAVRDANAKAPTPKDTEPQLTASDKINQEYNANQAAMNARRPWDQSGQIINQAGDAAGNAVRAAVAFENATYIRAGGEYEAIEKYLDKLLSTVQQVMQKAGEESSQAQKAFESILQMFQAFAETLKRGA